MKSFAATGGAFVGGAAAGLMLGAAISAQATGVATSPEAVAGYHTIQPLALSPRPDQPGEKPASIDLPDALGGVTPPQTDAPVLKAFDAISASADVDLEREAASAALRALGAEPTVAGLEAFWQEHERSLKDIERGAPAPPLFLDRMPRDLPDIRDVKRKKRAFIALMLPHILAVNEEITAHRNRIMWIRDHLDDPDGPSAADLDLLFDTFADYKVEPFDFDRLLARLDVIPPALAIAQAAKESGWGGSRFAQAGNALYGQWTWNPKHKGIVPRERPKGKTYRVRAFDNVLDATRAYARNLNTTAAYGKFRVVRQERRAAGKPLTGLKLAETLLSYSAIGQRYVRALKSLINKNGLKALNDAELAETLVPLPAASAETYASN